MAWRVCAIIKRTRSPNGAPALDLISAVVKIDHKYRPTVAHHLAMKVSQKETLTVRCPTCGAKSGERCELSTGLPRTNSHRDRRAAAAEKEIFNSRPAI
jgi:hypothetical protein